jgi:hypothetical protein
LVHWYASKVRSKKGLWACTILSTSGNLWQLPRPPEVEKMVTALMHLSPAYKSTLSADLLSDQRKLAIIAKS